MRLSLRLSSAVTDSLMTYSYGEQGRKLILLVLLKLFPLKDWNSIAILPLTPMQATELILVPETTVSLIAEDIQGTPDEALDVMHESSRYGSLVFPSGEDDAGDEVGEHLVRERAMIRCGEVEIEDRVEARVLKAEGLWYNEENKIEVDESHVRDCDDTNSVRKVKCRPKPRPLRLPRK